MYFDMELFEIVKIILRKLKQINKIIEGGGSEGKGMKKEGVMHDNQIIITKKNYVLKFF